MTLQEKIEKARASLRGPVVLAAQRMFSSPDGGKVLDALVAVFEGDLLARDATGRVDSDGTLVNVGAARVIKFLRELAEADREEAA